MARVLIADDAVVARRIMKNILTSGGHEVVFEATSGQEALDGYRRLRPDLVMMDLTMPELDGLEAARSILAEFADARIIVASSVNSEAKVRESASLGVAAYLLKPFTTERALELAEKVLRL